MALQINTSEFKALMEYIRDQLLRQMLPVVQQNGYGTDAVGKAVVLSLPQVVTLEQYMADIGEKKERKRVVIEDDGFEHWWKAYPSANFEYRGMKFTSGRTLRCRKENCYQLYKKTIGTGVTGEQLLMALQKQVRLLKEESYDSGQNRMQYMSTSDVYLRAGKYEDHLYGGEDEEYHEQSNNCA